ncbi:MAG: M23 family metallopeptidase [Christensenellaceae bacterium]
MAQNLFSVSGDNADAVNSPAPAPSESPRLAPQSPKLSTKELAELLRSHDALPYIPALLYPSTDEDRQYELVLENIETTQAIMVLYENWLDDAIAEMTTAASAGYGEVHCNISKELPPWQMLSAVFMLYQNDRETLASLFPRLIQTNITFKNVDSYMLLNLYITPVTDPEIFYEFPNAGESQNMGALFLYTYLRTVYDDNFERYTDETNPSPRLTHKIAFPFDEAKYFDDTWHNSRDGGARLHTGTDINAPEGTPLLACVDGFIIDTGSGGGAGNYVVLQGKDGTQYHYYHMVVPTQDVRTGDEVLTGDIVGRTGNTGNSTANHLHLAIINTDGYYINPYPYLVEAMESLSAGQEPAA